MLGQNVMNSVERLKGHERYGSRHEAHRDGERVTNLIVQSDY